MIDVQHLCPGCMQHWEDPQKPCPHCGYPEKKQEIRESLPVFSILAGKYLLGCPLGKGGFGITYLGMCLPDEQIVAIKEYFPSDLAIRDADGESVIPADETKALYYRTGKRSFAEEGRLLSQFADVPGIVRFREMLHVGGTSYLIMDYVQGISLRKYMKSQGKPFAEDDALALMKPVLQALLVMHKKGVIHRDISPENLILSQDHRLTLIDFGAAREYSLDDDENLTVILKRGYAPEEQYHSDSRQGPWTDLYAACAVLYHMLTGILPQEAAERAKDDQLTPISRIHGLSISAATCTTLEKGLQVDLSERYPDIPSLMRDLYPKKTADVASETASDGSEKESSASAEKEKSEQTQTASSQNNCSSPNTTFMSGKASAFSPSSPAKRKKSKVPVIVAVCLIVVLISDFLFGGAFFYYLRGYREPWFVRIQHTGQTASVSDSSQIPVTGSGLPETQDPEIIEEAIGAMDAALDEENGQQVTAAIHELFKIFSLAADTGDDETLHCLGNKAVDWCYYISGQLSAYDFFNDGTDYNSDRSDALCAYGKLLNMLPFATDYDSSEQEASAFVLQNTLCELSHDQEMNNPDGELDNLISLFVYTQIAADSLPDNTVKTVEDDYFDTLMLMTLFRIPGTVRQHVAGGVSSLSAEETYGNYINRFFELELIVMRDYLENDELSMFDELYTKMSALYDSEHELNLDAVRSAGALLSERSYPEGYYYYKSSDIHAYLPSGYDFMLVNSCGVYYGRLENGIRSGWGVQITLDGDGDAQVYAGEWDDNSPNGEGTYYTKTISGNAMLISGTWTSGLEDGEMTIAQGWDKDQLSFVCPFISRNGVREYTGDTTENGDAIFAKNEDGAFWFNSDTDGTWGTYYFTYW